MHVTHYFEEINLRDFASNAFLQNTPSTTIATSQNRKNGYIYENLY
jgi:hypothetical protein